MKSRVQLLIANLIFVLSPLSLQAEQLNIDLGDHFGGPSDAYGAVSGQAGRWNTVGSLGVTSDLVDTAAVPTPVSITVSASTADGYAGGCSSADADALVGDNVYTSYGAWTATLAGLANGLYEVFLYAPHNSNVATGNMLVNGNTVESIPGASDCDLSEGVGSAWVRVAVLDGTLSMTGDPDGTGYSHAGLAGLQLREVIFADSFEFGDTSAWSITVQ
jgi:hypothetical protein